MGNMSTKELLAMLEEQQARIERLEAAAEDMLAAAAIGSKGLVGAVLGDASPAAAAGTGSFSSATSVLAVNAVTM